MPRSRALRTAVALTLAMALYLAAVTLNSIRVLAQSLDPDRAFVAYVPVLLFIGLLCTAAYGAWHGQRWSFAVYLVIVGILGLLAWRALPAVKQFVELAAGSGPWTYWVAVTPITSFVLALLATILVWRELYLRR